MEGQIFNANDLEWDHSGMGKTKVLVGKETSKTGEFKLICLDPGDVFESHEHDFLQCMYFTKGHGSVSVDDTKREIEPGLTAVVLPRQCHSVKNTGDEVMEIIVFETYQVSSQNTPFVDF